MNRLRLTSRSPRGQATGFTIIEIVLAVAIIATAFVAVLGVLPVGLDASRKAQDATTVANILETVHHRLAGEPLPTTGEAEASFSPALFDAQGNYLPPGSDAAALATAHYRADVTLTPWQTQPKHTKGLRVAEVALSWPVLNADGDLPAHTQPQVVVSFPVTALTGSDWPDIAKEFRSGTPFQPKIEF